MLKVLCVVINLLVRSHHARGMEGPLTGIQIAIKPREVAAGNVEPNPMAPLEKITCRPQEDRVVVHVARLDQLAIFRATAIPRTHNAVRQEPGIAVSRAVEAVYYRSRGYLCGYLRPFRTRSVSRKLLERLVGPAGIEPATNGL